jgi:hypothetical protein
MTSGVRTSDGLSAATNGWSASKFSSRPHRELAGDHATGRSVPLAIALSLSPEATLRPWTNTTLPSTVAREALKARMSGRSSSSFSGE